MARRPWFTDKNGNKKIPLSLEEELRPTQQDVDNAASNYLKRYDELRTEFKYKTKLNDIDMGLMFIAAGLQCLRWALLPNDSYRFSTATGGEDFVEKIGKAGGKVLPTFEQIMMDHQVPYDAIERSDFYNTRFTDSDLNPISTGIAGPNHRYTTLGHDPLAGLVVGTMNIATNTLTKNDFTLSSYIVNNNQIDMPITFFDVIDMTKQAYQENPMAIGGAFIKQNVHCFTDVATTQGLPLPIINNISPEASKYLIGNRIDLYSVTRGVMLTILINKFVEMIHRMYFNSSQDDKRLYNVRTMKVVTYSNILSSVMNIGYVGISGDMTRLDVGGILVTLWRIFRDKATIRKIEYEFIQKSLDEEYKAEEDKAKQELAILGFEI